MAVTGRFVPAQPHGHTKDWPGAEQGCQGTGSSPPFPLQLWGSSVRLE